MINQVNLSQENYGQKFSNKGLHNLCILPDMDRVLERRKLHQSNIGKLPKSDKHNMKEVRTDFYSHSTSYFSFDLVAFVERILEPRPGNILQSICLIPPILSLNKVTLLDVLSRLWLSSYGFHLKIKKHIRHIWYQSYKSLKKLITQN